jgi:hypothetical protein
MDCGTLSAGRGIAPGRGALLAVLPEISMNVAKRPSSDKTNRCPSIWPNITDARADLFVGWSGMVDGARLRHLP